MNDGLAREPDNIVGLMARAQIRQSKGEAAGAIADYDAVLKHDPRNLPALNARAMALMQTKSYAKAADDFDRVIRLEPKNAQAYYQRGLAREQDNKFARRRLPITRWRSTSDRHLERCAQGARACRGCGRGATSHAWSCETKEAQCGCGGCATSARRAPRKDDSDVQTRQQTRNENVRNRTSKAPEPVKQAALPKEVDEHAENARPSRCPTTPPEQRMLVHEPQRRKTSS